MKPILAAALSLCVAFGLSSCSKPASDPQPTPPVVTPPAPASHAYAFDSSFKSTGSFATMGALQADGKLVVANTTQIARLNQDGSLDNSFTVGSTTNGAFHSLALQSDGKVLLGGSFTSYNGQNKAYYLRLNTDGSVDNGFTTLPLIFVSSHPNIDIRSIAVQPDKKILIGGNFYHVVSDVNGVTSGPKQIMRLEANGAYDASFKHNVSARYVNCLRLLSDGKLLVTGQAFNIRIPATQTAPEQNFNTIAKLNADGSLDPSLKWPTTVFAMRSPLTYLPAYGQTVAVQEDGKILLGGRFQTTSSVTDDDYTGLVRLSANGAIDRTLPKRSFTGVVPALCLASDRIIIGTMHDPDRSYMNANIAIHHLNKDGSDHPHDKVANFTGYGDTYQVLEDANKNLYLIGKFYEKMAVAVYTFRGVVRLKKT